MFLPILYLILNATLSAPSPAEIAEIVTPLQSVAEQYEGFEVRANISEVVSHVESGNYVEAWTALRPALDRCNDLTSKSGYLIASVSTALEAQLLRKKLGDDPPIKFIDMACPSAYKMAGFLFVSAREFKKAGEFLERAAKLAPFYAEPYVEKGYLLRVRTDYVGALAAYRRAITMSDQFTSAKHVKAIALRGVGFTLTEMGDLQGAREAYESSLLIEPNSQNAKHEIEYINNLDTRRDRN